MIAGIASVITAFGFQPVVYPVYLGLTHRTAQRGYCMISTSVILTSLVYAAICILGVLCFPNSHLTGDILRTLGANIKEWSIVIPNIVYLILMAMHLPVVFFLSKESLLIMAD